MIFTDWYLPGFKAGGPVTSISNLVRLLSSDYQIYIITSDRDLNEAEPYPNLVAGRWLEKENYFVYYSSPSIKNYKLFKNLIFSINPNYIYINSMFSVYFTLFPLLIRKLNRIESNFIISPRGMLRESALSQKWLKKYIFMKIQAPLQLFKNVIFHSTDHQENNDIHKYFLKNHTIHTIENVALQNIEFITRKKEVGKANLVFTGRIHPIKGLLFLLSCLKLIKGEVELFIIGPIEDTSYYNQCCKTISTLPNNVTITWLGHKSFEEIKRYYTTCHFFILPTQGENFGHAIFEALANGLPVLISDQTPWKNLSLNHAGWDLSLNNKNEFMATIQHVVAMPDDEYQKWSHGAFNFLKMHYNLEKLKLEYQNLFN